MGKLGFWPVVAISIGGMVDGDISAALGPAVQLALGGAARVRRRRTRSGVASNATHYALQGGYSVAVERTGSLLGKSRRAYDEYGRMKSEISSRN